MNAAGFYADYGLPIIFGAVLVQQLGVPIPVFPLLILAGAQAFVDPVHGIWALALSVLASSLGNYAWFRAGRRYGYRVLKAVCRMSLSQDSCVSQTESAFERYGPGTLVIARFLPGLGMVAPPLAGGVGLETSTFLLFNGVGSMLWAAAGLALGWAFHAQVESLLDALATLGNQALVLVPVLVALYVAVGFDLRPPVKLGLLAMAISPVPPFLASKEIKHGGEASYAVGLAAAVSLLSILFVPASVYVLSALLATPVRMSPRVVAILVGESILLPLAVGLID